MDETSATPTDPSLSLIVPAYNESARIAATLAKAVAYLSAQPYASELIVVDDGSTDATAAIARQTLAGHPTARVLSIPHGGKAAALRAGMLAAAMDQIAFTDADLATPLSYLAELRAAVAGGCEVAIGSREGAGARRVGEPVYRHLMGRVFNRLVQALLLPGIDDTQCGFKLFRREAARQILRRARLYTAPGAVIAGPRVTAFDVELLVVARRLGYKVCQIPVVWTYGTQSKVQPARDTWNNLRDVLVVRVNAWLGRYRMPATSGLAQRIANGHASRMHVLDRRKYPSISTPKQFAALIDDVMTNPDVSRPLRSGRHVYWQDATRTVVVLDPNHRDGGTAFRPHTGRGYLQGKESDRCSSSSTCR